MKDDLGSWTNLPLLVQGNQPIAGPKRMNAHSCRHGARGMRAYSNVAEIDHVQEYECLDSIHIQ